MSLKAKLFSSIAAFALVACLLIVGVFAVSPANVNMGGSITFTAKDVLATISGSVAGIAESTTGLEEKIVFTEDTVSGTNSDWSGLAWNFSGKEDVVLTITVHNDSAERAFSAAITAPTDTADDNVKISTAYQTAASWDGEGTAITAGQTANVASVAAEGTLLIRVTFHIENAGEQVNDVNWSLGLALEDEVAAAEESA